MVHKKWIIILSILLVLTNGLVLFFSITNKNKIVEEYEVEHAKLTATVKAYGPDTTVYTVKSTVMPGDIITTDNTVALTQNGSSVTEQMVRNIDDIIGKEFKIALSNGTPITFNMVMEEGIRADTRDHDIIVDSWPVGLKVGDYIDIKITMPYGDDYVVVPHKRVYSVNENTLKLYLNAYEWNCYLGASVDAALNTVYGASIYADKYIEPGLQVAAIPYYAVPTNIAALLQKNPNIVDKEEIATTNEWRSSIEELLTIFRDAEDTVDTDGATLAEMRAKYHESVKSDMNTVREGESTTEEVTEEDEFTWEDANPSVQAGELENTLEDVDEAVTPSEEQ